MRPGARDLGEFVAQEVLPRLPVETIYRTVRWTDRRGRYWRGPCPLHGGDGPTAFSVDTVTKGWTCFSHCGSGSAVAYMNGGTTPRGRAFVEKVQELAALAGVPLPERERAEEAVRTAEAWERREGLWRTFLGHAQTALMGDRGKAARAYLTDRRGFGDAALADLGLYTTRDEVRAALVAQGFTVDEVRASGVVHDPRWEGRLIIPWRDRWGRLGTFAARDLTGAAEAGAKYLYLTTKGWARRKEDLLVFGLDIALRRKPPFLVLVEGLLDVVHLQALGFTHVAAIGGHGKEMKAERWAQLAGLGVQSVVLALDNDQSGRDGTLAAIEQARAATSAPVIHVVDPTHLGAMKDPDELVREKDLDAFLAVLKKREPAALFVGRSILGDVTPESPPHERQARAAELVAYSGTLTGERSALDKEDLITLAAARTGYTPKALADLARAQEDLRRAKEREGLLDAALNQARMARQRGEDPLAVTRDLMGALSTVSVRAEDAPPAFSVGRLESESAAKPPGRPSGWDALDRLEVAFHPGELAVIGARTGHGKTSALVGLLLNWARVTSDDDEVFVLYSHEEPEVRIFHRLLALLTVESGGGWTAGEVRDFLRDGFSARSTWHGTADALNLARKILINMENRLLVVYRPAWAVDDLVLHANALAAHRKVGAVLVDYLQRIPAPPGRYDRRDIEVSTVARRLKALAVDLAAPVVVGAQINRDAVPDRYAEKLTGRRYDEARQIIRAARPDLANLREGGAEQEADLVLGLLSYGADFRTEPSGAGEHYKPPDVTRLEIGTLKNRYGVPGQWAALAFEGRFGLIRDPYPHEEEEI